MGTDTLVRTCPMCGATKYMKVKQTEYLDYAGGKLLQDAFPSLNPLEREFIKTGYCPTCQSMLFGSNYKSRRIKEFDSK